MSFLAELEKRVLLGAGAMGTELLRRGCLAERPLDELNLSRPHLVLDVTREYVAAGAEVIKTNTFRSNRVSLTESGLQDQVRELNRAGASIARDAARGAFVAGCVGPVGDPHRRDLQEVYREQCAALAEGGCDLLLLETFTQVVDLTWATLAAHATGLPVVSQMSLTQELVDRGSWALVATFARPDPAGADVIGVNCVSSSTAMAVVDRCRERTSMLSAFPDGGTSDHPVSPEAFAEGIRQLVDAGARLVGGCCGAGPDHIRAAAAVVGRGR
jgi:homocysteine S-methyltransferase